MPKEKRRNSGNCRMGFVENLVLSGKNHERKYKVFVKSFWMLTILQAVILLADQLQNTCSRSYKIQDTTTCNNKQNSKESIIFFQPPVFLIGGNITSLLLHLCFCHVVGLTFSSGRAMPKAAEARRNRRSRKTAPKRPAKAATWRGIGAQAQWR